MSSSTGPAVLKHHLHSSFAGHALLRQWHSDAHVLPEHLMYPVFVVDGVDVQQEIGAMPEQYRFSADERLCGFLQPLVEAGLRSVLLFGVIDDASKKDELASHATHDDAPVIRATRLLRQRFPELLIAVDLCLCAYTSHGHCGIFKTLPGTDRQLLDNEQSVARIADLAEAYARAGAHIVAPSDMMDCRIRGIKERLHAIGMANVVSVMAYSAKFASAFYGPFREAAHSAPAFGDRKAYQLPPGSRGLALRALRRDVKEGADIIMIKPAMSYLDIVRDAVNLDSGLPVAAYHVSGEYAMLYAASKAGALDLKLAVDETFTAMRRAGVTIIISYFVPFFLRHSKRN